MAEAISSVLADPKSERIQVPDWLEKDIRVAKLRPELAQALRRMYVKSQARGREVLAAAGCSDWDEYELRRLWDDIDVELERAGVPARLRNATFGKDPLKRPAMQAAFQWWTAERAATALVLAGPKGVGKSWAAAAVCRGLIEQGRSVLWEFATNVVAEVRRGDVRFSTPATCDVLVIDALGSEPATDKAKIDALIYTRRGAQRTTIMTTRLRRASVYDRYGEQVDAAFDECAVFAEIPAEIRT